MHSYDLTRASSQKRRLHETASDRTSNERFFSEGKRMSQQRDMLRDDDGIEPVVFVERLG